MLQIYCAPPTVNSRKVLTGLALLGTPYKLKRINFPAGEHKQGPYLAINPNGTVPAAIDGPCTITESNAILTYAADITHAGNSPFYPADLKKRAAINAWLFWESASWFPSCYVFLEQNVFADTPDASILAAEDPRWQKLALVLEAQLSEGRFLTGNVITIADVVVASSMHLRRQQALPLEGYPNLLRWIESVERLPCWKSTQGPVDEAFGLEEGKGK